MKQFDSKRINESFYEAVTKQLEEGAVLCCHTSSSPPKGSASPVPDEFPRTGAAVKRYPWLGPATVSANLRRFKEDPKSDQLGTIVTVEQPGSTVSSRKDERRPKSATSSPTTRRSALSRRQKLDHFRCRQTSINRERSQKEGSPVIARVRRQSRKWKQPTQPKRDHRCGTENVRRRSSDVIATPATTVTGRHH